MRRFFCLLLAGLLLAAPCALAQGAPWDAILSAVQALNPDGLSQDAQFKEAGGWMSAIVSQEGMIAPRLEGTQWHGLVYDTETGEPVAWDDLFADGDAAAARMEEIAEESTYDNAYAEYNQITPLPRESFAVYDGVLTVYYPAEQLSHFSGRSGAFSFYAYELDGLLNEGVPLAAGDVAGAKTAMAAALTDGALPAPLDEWKLGGSMSDAADKLGVVDVPDLTHDFAVYRFEAPEMRGVSLLAKPDEENVNTASIAGIMAERIDFSGLQTGVSTREECVAALGEPAETVAVDASDAYSRLPVGEALMWSGDGKTVLELHFAEGVLYSVTLWGM